MTAQALKNQQENRPTACGRAGLTGKHMTPAVDIFESETTLTLVADLPGVDREDLNINLEKGLLTINGEITLENQGDSLQREFSAASYYRQFRLSELMDGDKTSAELSNGVLTLQIPKAEAAKPKRIEVKH